MLRKGSCLEEDGQRYSRYALRRKAKTSMLLKGSCLADGQDRYSRNALRRKSLEMYTNTRHTHPVSPDKNLTEASSRRGGADSRANSSAGSSTCEGDGDDIDGVGNGGAAADDNVRPSLSPRFFSSPAAAAAAADPRLQETASLLKDIPFPLLLETMQVPCEEPLSPQQATVTAPSAEKLKHEEEVAASGDGVGIIEGGRHSKTGRMSITGNYIHPPPEALSFARRSGSFKQSSSIDSGSGTTGGPPVLQQGGAVVANHECSAVKGKDRVVSVPMMRLIDKKK